MSNASRAARRPYWLILLAAIAALANLIGLAGRIADLPRDSGLALPVSPWLGIATTAAWALAFAGLALALWRRASAAAAIFWSAPLFTLYALVGLLALVAFARADYDRGRIGAEVAASSLVLVVVWWRALRVGRPGGRSGKGAA